MPRFKSQTHPNKISRSTKTIKSSQLIPNIMSSSSSSSNSNSKKIIISTIQQPKKIKPKSNLKPLLTHSPSDTQHLTPPLSLLSFHDLSAQIHSLPSQSHFKLKSSSRKSNKNSSSQRRHRPLPQSSDSDEVHSILLPPSNYSSRSSTPTLTKSSTSTQLVNLDNSFSSDDHVILTSPIADPHFIIPVPPPNPITPSPSNSRRQHVRAKSVASIFELDRSTSSSSKTKSPGARDDWDMPTPIPHRDLTWQQQTKSRHPTSTTHHDPFNPTTTKLVTHPSSKELSSPRHQKSTLTRTSSAGNITRPQSADYLSRSEDDPPLTWQQTIIRPSLKPKSLPSSHHNHSSIPTELKPVGGQKKNQTHFSGLKTPTRPISIARKVGVHSAVKTKLAPTPASTKRRNSLSSGQTFRPQKQSDPTPSFPIESQSDPESLKDLSWQSFPTSAIANKYPDFPSVRSKQQSLVGDLADQTRHRRHTKSYTHPPTILLNRRPTQSSPSHHTVTSPSNIPESNLPQMMSTPRKARSNTEDLNLSNPEKQLTTLALRAAFMYAGPQFHNSPRPAALPAPKFFFGSA